MYWKELLHNGYKYFLQPNTQTDQYMCDCSQDLLIMAVDMQQCPKQRGQDSGLSSRQSLITREQNELFFQGKDRRAHKSLIL